MAIQGTFLADFSQFSAAVRSAEVTLRGFEANSNKVEASLSRMTESFSGTKVIQQATIMAEAVERVGGVSKLTESELARVSGTAQEAAEKLRRMGQDVPPGIQRIADAGKSASGAFAGMGATLTSLAGAFGVAFSVGAIVNFTKEVFNSTAALADLSKATGVSTEALQKLGLVMAGDVNVEELARALGALSTRIGRGDASVRQAVEDLGLSFAVLRQQSPEDVLLDVAEAATKLDNPMTRNAILADLFGDKLARILIPALDDLRAKYDALPDGAVISDETIASADKFDAALRRLGITLKGVVAEAIAFSAAPWIAGFTFLRDKVMGTTTAIEQLRGSMEMAVSHGMEPMASHGQTLITDADIMRRRLEDWRKEGLEPLNEEQRKAIELGREKHKSDVLIAETLGVSVEAVRTYVGALKDQTSEQDKVTASIDRMISSQSTLLQLLPLQPKDITIGSPGNEFNPTGAYGQILAEETGINQQATDLEAVNAQMTENFLIVGQLTEAHTAAGEAAKVATDQTVLGYGAVTQAVALSAGVIEEWIRLMEYSAKVNAILYENTLFTGLGQRKEIARLSEGGLNFGGTGGGTTVINNNNIDASNSFYNKPEDIQRLAIEVGNALVARQRAIGATT